MKLFSSFGGTRLHSQMMFIHCIYIFIATCHLKLPQLNDFPHHHRSLVHPTENSITKPHSSLLPVLVVAF